MIARRRRAEREARGGPKRGYRIVAVLAAVIGLAIARHGALLSVETTTDRRVRIGAFFDDESPMKAATVRVTDREGATVAEGKTDERGFYAWTDPTPGYFAVIADDGAGHRGRQTFTLAAVQLDGTVRDLIAETGRQPTLGERIRALPRWLTALAGMTAIVAVFALLAWRRAVRELTALRAERQ